MALVWGKMRKVGGVWRMGVGWLRGGREGGRW